MGDNRLHKIDLRREIGRGREVHGGVRLCLWLKQLQEDLTAFGIAINLGGGGECQESRGKSTTGSRWGCKGSWASGM